MDVEKVRVTSAVKCCTFYRVLPDSSLGRLRLGLRKFLQKNDLFAQRGGLLAGVRSRDQRSREARLPRHARGPQGGGRSPAQRKDLQASPFLNIGTRPLFL